MVRKNSYALRLRGHSMIDDHIQDGDIIIVEKRETAENGESVVAMINGERVTLKRFLRGGRRDSATNSEPGTGTPLPAPRGVADPRDRGRCHPPELTALRARERFHL
jgi:hypothetical protein